MQDPIYSKIAGTPRPTIAAANVLVLLAAAGLWASSLLGLVPGVAFTAQDLAYYLLFMALPLAVCARRRPGLSASMRLNPPPELPLLGVALLAVVSVYVASGLAALWGFGLDALGLRGPATAAMPETRRALALSVLTMAALPAVCEELLFRGFVLAAWESRGTAFAVGVSAALFALLHANLYGLPAHLLVGIVSGCVTFALDSVYAGIIYHTVYNAAGLVLSYLLSGAGDAGAELGASVLLPLALETAVWLALLAGLLAALLARARGAGVTAIPRVRRPLSPRDRLTLLAALLVMLASGTVVLALARMGASL